MTAPTVVTARTAAEQALGAATVKELWSSIYLPALPFTPQDFSIGSVMPMVLYMMRWGHRRGRGNFEASYGQGAAAEQVIEKLVTNPERFRGFESPAEKAILGDLLLAFTMENRAHRPGRTEQLSRTYPVHYLSTWIDLPTSSSALRFVPEAIVAILNPGTPDEQLPALGGAWGTGGTFDDNRLLKVFGTAMQIKGNPRDLQSDHLIETEAHQLSLDQLLMARVAQECQHAPLKARKAHTSQHAEFIMNRQPLSHRAAQHFREDFTKFVELYAEEMPRQAFVQMLECCLSLGLTTLTTSLVNCLLLWERSGAIPEHDEPFSLFIDCSVGADIGLRAAAEESMQDVARRFERLPVTMMCMRILEQRVKKDRQLRDNLPAAYPDSTEFLNLLGSILIEKHPRAEGIAERIDEDCIVLADELEKNDLHAELVELLRRSNVNPVLRLSEALTIMMGRSLQAGSFLSFFDACMMIGESQPHALGRKRRTQRTVDGKRRSMDVRSLVLSNTMLDFFVHLHATEKGGLPFAQLLKILRERYGLYVDKSPPERLIPVETLQRNKAVLERRLRDMGLLDGVNDAEAMKRVKPRFHLEETP